MNEAMQRREVVTDTAGGPEIPPLPVTIFPVLNGFVVKAGCQLLVFQTIERTMSEIARYYREPNKVRQEYEAAAINRTLANFPQAPMPPCRDTEDIGSLLRNR